MKRKSSVLVLGAAIFMASCTVKTIPTNGESDDMYATSADAAQTPIIASSSAPFNKNNALNMQQFPYEDEFDRTGNSETLESTDDYYSEDYITSRDFKRKASPNPGYSDGYSDGYSQGWVDNSWSQPIAMGWNSPFNRFGFNSFSPFNSGVFISYGFGGGWGMNSWNRFSPWGFNSWNNPWMMDAWAVNSWGFNNFNSPWGFNNFYSPWGFNNFNSPWGFNNFNNPYDFYGRGFNNYRPFYNNQSVVAQNAYRNGSRTYGARETGRNSSNFNDRFVNSSRPVASASSGRTSSMARNNSSNANNSNGERVLADRKNGNWVGNTSSNNASNRTTYPNDRINSSTGEAYNPGSNRAASYDSYNKSSNSGTRTYNSRSSSLNSTSQGNTYTRPSSSRASSNNSYSSPNYDRGSSTYSSPSRGSSSSSSSSSGGSSRGSSGVSSSGGGSSRGPR